MNKSVNAPVLERIDDHGSNIAAWKVATVALDVPHGMNILLW